MESLLKEINVVVSGLFLPAVLFVSGAFFFIRIGTAVFSPRFLRAALGKRRAVTRGAEATRAQSEERKGKENERSPFSSLCLALAGTLGVGNISGVTAAITVGGPGAVFWIWVSAVASSVLKFSETVLAMRYRKKDKAGVYRGGAYLYIKEGLGAPSLAAVFCALCIFTSFTMGSITQTRAAADGVFFSLGIPPVVCGAVFFIVVLFLSLGGGKRISDFTVKLIPTLCLGYVLLSAAVIFIFRKDLAAVTSVILSEAFTPRAGVGGVFGVLTSDTVRYGVARGIMSNEAGCGTAPFAHARAETESAVRQGVFGIIEVLTDTLVLCTLTAYVVLLSGVSGGGSATETAINAFSSALGDGVRVFLGISLFLFALGSVAGWSFYGQESVRALGGGKRTLFVYGTALALSSFIGCIMSEGAVWELADLSISLMAVINVGAVLMLSPYVVTLTREFYSVCRVRSSRREGAPHSDNIFRFSENDKGA